MSSVISEFWKDKKVFITGHTGFKGSWLCEMLLMLGADVYGYSLNPPTEPSMFDIIDLKSRMKSYIGDIRNFDELFKVYSQVKPEIVFHLAPQPIVRESYSNPRYTYETNVMGTVNILECIRKLPVAKSVVNVTTDKVYENKEWCWGYRETDRLDGFDPYSNSKSCSELITSSYIRSFFLNSGLAISTVRAGNVIGGGDFAPDRIIPDCVRAASENRKINIRNPYSVRPYQHVLDPLYAYLMIAHRQYNDSEYAGSYNIGPDAFECISTQQVADRFCEEWCGAEWESKSDPNKTHEAKYLRLDCSKIRCMFEWKPKLNIFDSINQTVKWYMAYYKNNNMENITQMQIKSFLEK